MGGLHDKNDADRFCCPDFDDLDNFADDARASNPTTSYETKEERRLEIFAEKKPENFAEKKLGIFGRFLV